ncbi:WD repeat-containing protein WRAP73, partial [Caerostris extrusa]
KVYKTLPFGLTCFSWNCNGNLITLGDYFGTVTILHSSNYDEIISYHEKESIECKMPVKDEATSSNWELYAVIKDRPFNFGALVSQSEKTKTKPTCGVHTLKYSHCGQYLASLSGSLPKVVFIFDLNTFQLSSIIIHLYKIKDISWHPEKPVLAICSGSGNLDLWTSSCCISICSPFKGDLSIINAQWCTIKDCLLLNGKDRSTLLHLPDFSYENSTAIKK